MTAKPTTQTTIEAMKLGAYDSIIKGRIDWNAFTTLIRQAVEDTRFQRERPKLSVPLAEPDAIIGNSSMMHAMYKQIGRLAAKSVAVLIRGETGTGKELVALQSSHSTGGRRSVQSRQMARRFAPDHAGKTGALRPAPEDREHT
jgi:DNA-binding NtrC family response regulator